MVVRVTRLKVASSMIDSFSLKTEALTVKMNITKRVLLERYIKIDSKGSRLEIYLEKIAMFCYGVSLWHEYDAQVKTH